MPPTTQVMPGSMASPTVSVIQMVREAHEEHEYLVPLRDRQMEQLFYLIVVHLDESTKKSAQNWYDAYDDIVQSPVIRLRLKCSQALSKAYIEFYAPHKING